jgi:CubicO group peptidase (beta-lactamase class C family)
LAGICDHGKDKVTVQHVLHHRSGVWQMPEAVTPERLADYDWMVDAIARLPPMFEPGTRNGYQGLTFGWMISEVVRRTDPKGRSFRPWCRMKLSSHSGSTISGWVSRSVSIRVSRV